MTTTAAQAPLDEASSCWLCLEEGLDNSGKPLVRNCSCRGSSGFAHISCIINFAESESKKAYTQEI
jgi:E3 ubiquitin-protein ligase DOA10